MNRQAKKHVYTFGPIIHNEEVVGDLRSKRRLRGGYNGGIRRYS